jgi:hypothetical protein
MTCVRNAAVRNAAAIAAILGCAALPPWLLHQALAATAGTLFEAAPFVLAVSLAPGAFVRRLAALLGCGCGSAAGPAALSLPAAALCWTVFGPDVALVRFGAAAALHAFGRRSENLHAEPDVLGQLLSIAVPAFALALATTLLGIGTGLRWPAGLPAPVALGVQFGAGFAAGTFAPCSTAAVALAAMLRGPSPFAAAGMLASAGIVPVRRPSMLPKANGTREASLSIALVGLACAALAVRGGSGLVNPRLVPLLWLALPAALAGLRTRPVTRTRFGVVAPLLMAAALVLGSPVPQTRAPASTLDDVYPGEAIAFLGRATYLRRRTTLVRYAITCCRADATAIVVPTTIPFRFANGAWLRVRGTIAEDGQGAIVRVTSWQRVRAPADPFTYR